MQWIDSLPFHYQLIFFGWLVAIAFALYMLPFIIGRWRRHPQASTIALITFLFGWTVIGWIAILAYSLRRIDRRRRS